MTGADRVAHVTTAHPARDIRIFHKECVALARTGVDVHLVAVADHDIEEHGVVVTALPRRRGRLGRMLLGPVDVWRALRRIRPGLLHVHDPELVPLAILWHWMRRRPAVYDAHEDLVKQVAGKSYLPRLVRPVVARVAALVERSADVWLSGIVVATPSISRNYHSAQVVLVQNFPWSNTFATPEEIREEQRDAVYVGALTAERGLAEMLELAESSRAHGSLLLAGSLGRSCLPSDLDNAPGLQYRGLLPAAAVPQLLAEARVGLALLHPLPNYVEAQATKIYEYMAAGRPFVASDFPAWVAQLGPFGCGIFVDPLDSLAVSRAVEALRSDLVLAQRMGRRGRQAWEMHFTFEAEAERLVALTTRLLHAS